jgi:4-hydroxy-tetrahydrodipicolinate synthase
MPWSGVWPAITTPFDAHGAVDLDLLERHVRWLVASGCSGVVALGSLAETAALSWEEKCAIVTRARAAVGSPDRILAGVSSGSTEEAVRWAREAERRDVGGLMVLPPYVYRGDPRETALHFAAVFEAVSLPAMLYNNPVVYGTDVPPDEILALARRHPNLVAVKESSGDLRRLTALALSASRPIDLFVGIDDQILEGLALGAHGWIAGLANALPAESVALFDRARAGRTEEARALYRWFLPLLRMDTELKFVQLIKLAEEAVGVGSPRVRPPRQELSGPELERARMLLRSVLSSRPELPSAPPFPT